MNSFRAPALLLLCGLFALPGCGGEKAKSTTAGEDAVAARKPRAENAAGDPVPGPPGDGLTRPGQGNAPEGRWLLRLTVVNQGFDFPLALVDVSPDGKSTKVVEMDALLEEAKIETASLDGADFHLRATLKDGDVFEAVGELRDGNVWGNATIEGRLSLWPIQLLPTRIKSLDEVDRGETAGRATFIEAMQTRSSAALETFARTHESSPLAMAAQQSLLLDSQTNGETPETVRTRASRFRELAAPWGKRAEHDALHTVAMILVQTGYQPAVTREIVAELRKALGDAPAEPWGEELAELDRRIDVLDARQALETGTDEAAKAKARATLTAAHVNSPTDPTIAYTLATDAEARGEKEEALKLYAELTALPGLEIDLVDRWQEQGLRPEPPSDRFKALWSETHAKEDRAAREAFLTKVYEDRTYYFQGDQAAPRTASEGNQVVLVELFTGAQCPGCAMADIALGGAERKYAPTELVALRYHQHVPGPDPFATPTTESRFFYYDGQATPSIYVNGKPTIGIGGIQLREVELAWKLLSEEIEPELPNRTEVAIDLSAVAKDETLKVTAKVSGLGDKAARPRLRIAVAESSIPFNSRNGVRVQEMVVRWMLPDIDGIAPKEGELAYEGTFELPELRQQLVDALDDYEKSENIEFVQRPMDLRDLKVVAFVQDDANQAVLQAKVVALEGTPVFDARGAVPGK